MKRLQAVQDFAWFQRLYVVTIIFKGVDGLIELIAGIMLLVAPGLLHQLLAFVSGQARLSHGHFMQVIADNIARIDSDLTRGGVVVVILFLVTHGIIKLALVVALLKKLLWAYPYALLVLGLFFLYQLYVWVVHPTIGMAFFTVLDAIIIVIVWGEWRKLLHEKPAQASRSSV